jgi:peptide/nickel transport system permease protein
MLGLQSAQMLGGSVVIESVFSVPGLGRLAQEAVAARDTPLLLGIILVSAVLVIVINLLVDIAYAFLDPRVGANEAGA